MKGGNNHESVLLEETIESLNLNHGDTAIDCTYGRGGHSRRIWEAVAPDGKIYAFDQDAAAHDAAAHDKTVKSGKIIMFRRNFDAIQSCLKEIGVTMVNAILYDLGVSSPQFDDSARGFSYRLDAPLDMRMDQRQELTAAMIVNEYEPSELMRIFRNYGESPFARSVTSKIVASRPIKTTQQLVDIIKSALPQKVLKSSGHPAKVFFQALRIEVNDELNVLRSSLEQAAELTALGGRIAVITFHSLEDRIVKEFFRELTTTKIPREVPVLEDTTVMFRPVTKKPITPATAEIARNRRARSAKLRVVERIRWS